MRRILLFCVLLAACGSKAPRGLWTDPSLDATSLADGIVIGGVQDLTAEHDLFALQRDAELLEAVLRRERPGVPVTSWGEARALVETESLDALLGGYRLSGRLGPRELAQLEPLREQGRYFALARIDLDQTLWRYERRTRESGDRVIVDVEPESAREMALLFDLYDLELDRLAYTIPVKRTGHERGVVRSVDGMDAVPTEQEILDEIDDIERSSEKPEPADRTNLLESLLREAVTHLPD